jgi:hypothetical protein
VAKLSPQNPYQDAYKLACEALVSADIKERAEKSGATLTVGENGNHLITLNFLSRLCQIKFPDIEVTYQESDEEVPLWSKILILHYLVKSEGLPLSGKWINFKQVPSGSIYYPAFVKRSQKPLCDFFSERLDLLERAAPTLGGEKTDYGDRAVIIPALPRVPVVLVFWSGDEEFQPEAHILFDSNISSYLSTEDVAVLCQQIVFGLIKRAKTS